MRRVAILAVLALGACRAGPPAEAPPAPVRPAVPAPVDTLRPAPRDTVPAPVPGDTVPVPAPRDTVAVGDTLARTPGDTAAVAPPPDTLAAGPVPSPGPPGEAPRRPVPPARRCQFVIQNVDREGNRIEIAPGVVNYFAGGNVRFRCANLPVRIASDSVASYQGTVVQFIGGVRYRDSTSEMTADFGTYFRDAGKWEARGNVVLTNLRDQSTLQGPMLDYFPVVQGLRDSAEMYADQRPTVTLPVSDPEAPEAPPYTVVGDRIRMRGDDQTWAAGRVTIDRDDFRGRGDSLELDVGPAGEGALIGSAVVRRLAADSFELRGARIDLRLEQRRLTQATARDSARLSGTDLELGGDAIALDLAGNEVEHTTAWGRRLRPVALSGDYEVRGDSVAFDTPQRTLREIRSFGNAWLGAKADEEGDRDWVAGDTVAATFVQRDSAGTVRPALERLEARGNGRALYRFRQGSAPQLSYSYTKADLIVVTMLVTPDSVVVDSVFARGDVQGIHLQPPLRARPPAGDTLRTPVDTLALPGSPPRRRR